MLIAQISDFHVTAGDRLAYGRVDTATALAACVAQLAQSRPLPDLVLATGDLVDLGAPEEYARLRELLAPLDRPVYVFPGNHDERGALRAAFASEGYLPREGAFLQYAIEDWPLRILVLDTVVPGKGHGALCAERLAWLEARLAEQPQRPTVIAMHHPPFATGIAHMDRIGLLEGAAGLEVIVARHPQVERILCGHLHRAIQMRWAGTLASTAPSTAHQVTLDLREAGDSTFIMEPPGYQLHQWREGEGLVSHTAFIGRFPGPYPFYEKKAARA